MSATMSKKGSIPWLLLFWLGVQPLWSLDSTFNPGAGANAPVLALAVCADDSVLVGGAFTEFDGVPRSGIARLHPDGSLDLDFVVSAEVVSTVNSIAIQADGRVLLASTTPGPSGSYLIRVNAAGLVDGAFAPVINGSVHAYPQPSL